MKQTLLFLFPVQFLCFCNESKEQNRFETAAISCCLASHVAIRPKDSFSTFDALKEYSMNKEDFTKHKVKITALNQILKADKRIKQLVEDDNVVDSYLYTCSANLNKLGICNKIYFINADDFEAIYLVKSSPGDSASALKLASYEGSSYVRADTLHKPEIYKSIITKNGSIKTTKIKSFSLIRGAETVAFVDSTVVVSAIK